MAGEIEQKWDDVSKLETQSQTHLEDDKGEGTPIILRVFEFASNPEAFKQHKPTKQELFNYHHKQIEIVLWKDGMKAVPEVDPRIILNKKKTKYRIFVAATPQRGQMLLQETKTLSQLAHNK